MDYDALLAHVIALLQQEKRLAYRVLKRRLQLDDDVLEDLKDDLIYTKKLAVDEEGKVLVWTGDADRPPITTAPTPQPAAPFVPQEARPPQAEAAPAASSPPDAERRQLTVMFCDLVDSTTLASHLDPEDLQEVVRAYQGTCAEVIQRFDGYIAQYLGDGLLVYFGYPQAHEDDAQRAVRTGLGMVEALGRLNARLQPEKAVRLAIRVGVHTGLVVMGEMGGGARREHLALGETPNLAARLQALAEPDSLVISGATYRLVEGVFACRALGQQALKGIATPVPVYQVVGDRGAQSRFDLASPTALTLLVGREQEVGLLLERWAQVQEGRGQVAVLSGEAGIGKSRLVQVVKTHVAGAAHTRWECRASPYHQNSALYPVIDLFARALQWQEDDAPDVKLDKLEAALTAAAVPLPEVAPLLAAMLSLPLPPRYPPLTLTPQRQKEQTLHAILAVLLALAEQQPVLLIVEDLHWVDPSTLELLDLLIDQVPSARILTLLTCRPEFRPPWTLRAHLTQLTLSRLPRAQAEALVRRVTAGKTLPGEVLQQIAARTDGVPLFVEELTKMVLESGLLHERDDHYELTGPLPPLAIPATLHDSLMARLDRLAAVKAVAQLGATLGRAFPYALLRAVSPLDESALQQALARLVEAELLYQRGVPPQATYLFKHALIQEAAYQSLLKSTRQQSHQRIAQVLEERFPDLVETQPELLAQHYTEAGESARAIAYWQQAGERALQRSANLEAISHLRRGLEPLTTLPETQERVQQELGLQIALGQALMASRGYAAPEVETAYTRAYELGQHVGYAPQMLPVLWGLWLFAMGRAEFGRAQALGERLLHMGQRLQDSLLLVAGHGALGDMFLFQGELARAHRHVEQSVSLYDPQQHRALAFLSGVDYGLVGRTFLGWQRLVQGYPSQGLQHSEAALRLAQEVEHPYTLASTLVYAAFAHLWRRDVQRTREQAEALIVLATKQGFTLRAAQGALLHGWAVAMQGEADGGLAQMRQALSAMRATGLALEQSWFLGLFAEACGHVGQIEEGLHTVDEALAFVDRTGERLWEAELHRLKGELLRRPTAVQEMEAETCFQQAFAVARGQGAKWWELRAAMSLSRLWQRQGKHAEARQLLAEVYGWFTEGFDTADLQEAETLLDELA